MDNFAYVTAITNEKYYKGLKTLFKSLKATKTTFPLFVMMPEECRNSPLSENISKSGLPIIFCPKINISKNHTNDNVYKHWNETFFKLNIANLIQFNKIVFLDADMIVLKNIDHLFDYPSISATTGGKAAHPEWIEFNSGIMVMEPSSQLYEGLINCITPAITRKKASGQGYGDQDVFNQFFPEWKNEPKHNFGESYNAEHCFVDEFVKVHGKKSFKNIYVLHFIGGDKIWTKNTIQLIKMFHGLLHDKKFYEIKACIKYLKYLYL